MKRAPAPSKLTAPDVRDAYPRTRVFRVLDGAARRRLVWMWAPAGAGKTTLLASWTQARGLATLFYRVDRGDRDGATLFHFARRAAFAGPTRRARAPHELPVFTSDVGDLRAFARRFFEALFATTRTGVRYALVFDDGHEVEDDAPIWQVLREVLEVCPKHVSLIVASRRPPPAELARGIAHGDVAIVGFDTLKLTSAEAHGLLNARFGRQARIPPARARRLHEQAAGWAAGLMLLGAAQDAASAQASGAVADATQQHLFDYFATEILAAMPPEHRRYAMKTAVLGAVDPEVMESLIPPEERIATPDFLKRVSLVERHGSQWRYHPLFREFLLAKAPESLGEAALRQLRREACRVLLERERHDEAFELACGAGDLDELRHVVTHSAARLLELGRTRTLEHWTRALPEAAITSDPWLALVRAQAIWTGQPGEARRLFLIAAASPDPACATLGCAGALQATVFEGADFARLDPLLDQALARDIEVLPPALGLPLTITVIGAIGFRRPADRRFDAFVRHGHELVRTVRDERVRGLLAGLLVFHETFFGDPFAVESILDELAIGGGEPVSDPLARIGLLLARGVQRWLDGAVDEALSAVHAGLDAAARSGVHVWDDQLYAIGAASTISAGQREEGAALLEFLMKAARRSRFAEGNAEFYRAWDALAAGELAAAERSTRASCRAARVVGSPFARTLTSSLAARLDLARGAFEQAEQHLAEADEAAGETGSAVNRLPILIARVRLARASGRAADELEAIRGACAIMRQTGVLGYFLVTREDLAACAEGALQHGIEPAFARHLVQKLHLAPPETARALVRWPWRVRVHAFGRMRVDLAESAGGGAPSRRALELLAMIVAHGPGAAHQTRLSDALWPDAEGDTARASFDTTLLRLRRKLGGDGLVRMEHGRVVLDRGAVFVDLFAAQDWLGHAQAAFAANDLPRAAHALAELAGLARGRLFEDLDHSTFVSARRRFERRLLALLDLALGSEGGAPTGKLAPLVGQLLAACDPEDPTTRALARRAAG